MRTVRTANLAKLELVLAVALGAILWLLDVFVDGPWFCHLDYNKKL